MKRKNKKAVLAAGAFLLLTIAVLIGVGLSVWNDYKMTIISQQKKQMLLTTESIAKNMELSLERTAADLKQLCAVAEEAENRPELSGLRDLMFRQYIDEAGHFVTGILIRDRDGKPADNAPDLKIKEVFAASDMGGGVTMVQCGSEDGGIYFLMKRPLPSGGELSLVIDGDRYYEALISGIKLGTSGYVVVKNSKGILLMHPSKEQRGIDVIEGRKKLYNVDDLASLEEMLENQYQGKSGVSEYVSYWWGEEALPRVKKISAYSPTDIGDDFLIVSAVIDYNDIYIPIANGYIRIIMLLLLMFLAILGAAGYFVRLQLQRQKDTEEIAYLRELNGILEETRRSEEIIAHQQRLQIMGTMTGGIAHEFNNLLTPIMGYADLILADLPEDSEYYEDVTEIYEAAVKAREIIRQISSLSHKNIETAFKEISVKQMVKRALKMVRSVCPANIRLNDETDLDSEWILGNETQMNQVILNICVNAIHAIGHEDGQITVRNETLSREAVSELPRVTDLPDTWNSFIRIDFMDDGCGMNRDVLEQIFDPFFTTKKDGKGTGLGLALAEQIVRSHKGCIYAESEPGAGSVFHLLLPLSGQPASEEGSLADVERGKKILIVDDNAKVLKLLEKNFKKVNLSGTGAVSIAEALNALEREPFDVMAIDHFLSDTSAIDFCMSIRTKYPHMIKVVMTDHVRKEILEARQKGIIEAYVEKPVSVTSILKAIRDISMF